MSKLCLSWELGQSGGPVNISYPEVTKMTNTAFICKLFCIYVYIFAAISNRLFGHKQKALAGATKISLMNIHMDTVIVSILVSVVRLVKGW
jgi:hypothetical protein